MKAPKYQRMEILQAVIQTAGYELSDPIDGIEMTDQGAVVWAGKRFILLSYDWNQSTGESGEPYLGSGHWEAEYLRDCDASYRLASGNGKPVQARRWWRFW